MGFLRCIQLVVLSVDATPLNKHGSNVEIGPTFGDLQIKKEDIANCIYFLLACSSCIDLSFITVRNVE